MEMIPLYKPFMPAELNELNVILQSGSLSYGKWGRLFESKLSNYIGESKILVTNSFNSAMLVALGVIGIKHGDEIIASPMSCLASNQPFVTQGANVVWADIDPNTGTLDPTSVRAKISSKTKAIFHNHYCGYPGYIDEINQIAKEFNIWVVDDAIEAFGSVYKGNKIGNTGADITVFSFQTVRLPNTIDGGALAFKSNDLFDKATMIRDYGINRSKFRTSNFEINIDCDISLPGFGATLSDPYSYIGCLQMDNIETMLSIQKENALSWVKILGSRYPEIRFLGNNSDVNPNYWIFGFLTKNKFQIMDEFRRKGFFASCVHLPNNNYSVFGNIQKMPGVEEFYTNFLALPSGWWFNLNDFSNV